MALWALAQGPVDSRGPRLSQRGKQTYESPETRWPLMGTRSPRGVIESTFQRAHNMDDNSADEEIKDENLSPQQGGKKLKLNDGSSQDSLKDLGNSNKDEKDENVDSGISADKSESTSSDDRAVEAHSWAEGPSNEVVHAAPSSSNVRAILLQIKRPKKGNRNYRKRKNTPDRENDSDTSLQDSDDFTDEEETSGRNNEERRNSDEDNRSMDETTSVPSNLFAESDDETLSSKSSSSSSHNSDDSNESFDSSDLVRLQNIDSDSDEGPTEQDENQTPPSVLLKTRPKHNWFIVQGYLLASGSDDTNVIVWDWATDTALQSIKTGHKSNVFQSKFLYLNARSQLNIVTCARDGQVRLLQCPPSGGAAVSRRRLISHSKAAHKLYVSPSEPHLVISAGEDGLVMQADVRTDRPNR
ncbi:DDB1- and CUL4-associated factor 8 [Eumeta japonica]|uniref:DDB1-and CUL4-associated factor 8 n=1 Tax=Eumeta variegata TaxID=151549 RepID=A0A4C2A1K9_EUMVA|nr:DDB1- and CUL4-associated factor 8 [Eumeta japonica]